MGTLHPTARDLERSAPFQFQRSDDEPGDGRSLSGYAAVFGQDTEIDSWEGHFVETIRKGAFRKTIRETTPVMQFDHGRHPLIGSLPIGQITDLREDEQGLWVEARITDNWLMQPVRDAIAEGSVNGMSFRFEVVREEWRDTNGKLVTPDEVLDLLWMPGDRGPLRRELVEVRMRELGPVVFPAYAGTSVSVRARGMASELVRSGDMARSIRQSLARDAAVAQVPDDPELRREVAAALLFQRDTDSAAPLPAEHPAPETSPDGAPLRSEHPPAQSTTDAPPADGHPSPSPRTARMRSQLAEIGQLMDGVLASIDTKEKG
ncbi:HK97 family phage prohead protease [Streptomyces sp. CC228A]|uniref:HK97 family phage prohead protease n=1 Tax=Streptomyces sp. CC228A TaxID=2898186 RepID=UPI001F183F1A|nr:HK97 family phage prohead protease [Streptomyces sp. CC228A]